MLHWIVLANCLTTTVLSFFLSLPLRLVTSSSRHHLWNVNWRADVRTSASAARFIICSKFRQGGQRKCVGESTCLLYYICESQCNSAQIVFLSLFDRVTYSALCSVDLRGTVTSRADVADE